MGVAMGCEENRKTPKLEERVCPQCGEAVEVFTRDGRLVDDFACECGFVFRAEAPLDTRPDPSKKGE